MGQQDPGYQRAFVFVRRDARLFVADVTLGTNDDDALQWQDSGKVWQQTGLENCFDGLCEHAGLDRTRSGTLAIGIGLVWFWACGNMGNISVNTQGVMLEKLYGRSIFSAFHGVWSVGGFCGASIGLLMMKFDIAPAYHFIGIAVFIALNNLYFQKDLLPNPASQPDLPKWRIRKPKGILLQLGIMCFCTMSVEGCMFDWAGVYFKEVIQAQGQLVSLGYALFMISMATGRFLGDRLAEQFGRKRMVINSGIMIFTGLMVMVAFPMVWISALGCVISGLGVSSIVPLLYGSAGKLKLIPSSVSIASVAGIGYFGFLMGPPMIGFIAEATGLRVSLAIISLGGLLIVWVVRKVSIIS